MRVFDVGESCGTGTGVGARTCCGVDEGVESGVAGGTGRGVEGRTWGVEGRADGGIGAGSSRVIAAWASGIVVS
jgi:hypothetical protein